MISERELLKKALEAIKFNDEWHTKHDEHDGYFDSTIHDVNYSAMKEIEAELAKPEAEPAEVAVSMKAIRFAWEGNIKASADYIELMASRLEEHGKSDSAQYVRDFLAELKGEKKPTFIVTTEYSIDNSKQEAEPVAWMLTGMVEHGTEKQSPMFFAEKPLIEGENVIPLYTSSRPMQRLTDNELRKAAKVVGDGTLFLKIGRAIETALIEKNK
jgi:hypothetical protein